MRTGPRRAHITPPRRPPPPPPRPFSRAGRGVAPADLIRLAEGGLAGAVSVGGGASSHAAIIARGLGLPMLAGADPQVLAATTGRHAILDTGAGELIVDPGEPELTAARAATSGASGVRTAPTAAAAGADPDVRPAAGAPVTLLCNVASAAETRLGLSGGAAARGPLRPDTSLTCPSTP